MNEQKPTIDLNLFEEMSPFFGQTLVRDVLIPNLLGNETNEILYWAGKEIARQYPLSSIEDTILFFERAGFGDLAIQKRDQNTIIYLLTGIFVESRLKAVKNLSFNLEAGFLAEQIQQQDGLYTEARYELHLKKQAVTITIKQDTKDLGPLEKTSSFFSLIKPNEDLDSLFVSETMVEENMTIADNPATLPDTLNSELKDEHLNQKTSIFDRLPSRSSKHIKKK